MSADGEIDIAVRAEGAEDAAAELSGGGGAGGGGGGEGGLRQSIRGGIIGGLLSQLLGPLLDLLTPMLKILQAALAPLAALLLRLLSPVLRWLIQLLPTWMKFMDIAMKGVPKLQELLSNLPGMVWSFLSSLPDLIWKNIKSGASWFANGAAAIGKAVWDKTTKTLGDIWTKLKNLPRNLASSIINALPGDVVEGAQDVATSEATQNTVNAAASGAFPLGGLAIELQGGLEAFAKNIEQGSVDFLP
jgi:hypothetical protein